MQVAKLCVAGLVTIASCAPALPEPRSHKSYTPSEVRECLHLWNRSSRWTAASAALASFAGLTGTGVGVSQVASDENVRATLAGVGASLALTAGVLATAGAIAGKNNMQMFTARDCGPVLQIVKKNPDGVRGFRKEGITRDLMKKHRPELPSCEERKKIPANGWLEIPAKYTWGSYGFMNEGRGIVHVYVGADCKNPESVNRHGKVIQ